METTGTASPADDTGPYVYRLSDAELAATRDKIAKLNARAVRRGWTGTLGLDVTETEVTEELPSGLKVARVVNEVTITGQPPCYDGWTFLAKLEWDPEAGLIVSTAPGVGSVDRADLEESACGHCNKRRARLTCYLVRHADGRQMQVGSTCLKDFLGWDARPVFISSADAGDLCEEGGFFSSGGWRFSTETVLAAAWAAIQAFGYVRADSYSGTPTKYTVQDILDPRSPKAREMARDLAPHVDKAHGMAAQVRAWILSDEFTGDSEYVLNLKAIAAADNCEPKRIGLLASAPQAWARGIERSLIRKAETEAVNNTHAGLVKQRVEVTVTVKAIRWLEGDWGTTTLYTLTGDDARTYQWYATSDALGDEVTGKPVQVKGTIKRLDERNGANITVLTRCKVLAPAAA
jgi:hypothetical protein